MKISPELYEVTLNTALWNIDSEAKLCKEIGKFASLGFIPLKDVQYEEGTTYYTILSNEILVLNKDQIIELSLNNLKFKIRRKIVVEVDISERLIELAERHIKLVTEGGGNEYNTKCEVHMPGNALLLYNEILLLEDACTDILQSSLNSGWRIIAACQQPDTRRPDYILGRFNPNLEIYGDAKRAP